MINNKLNKNVSIVLLLVLVVMSIAFTFLIVTNDNNVFAEPIQKYVNTFTFDNYSSSIAFSWPNDLGNSFSDLSDLPFSDKGKYSWTDFTDFSTFKIADNSYNFCCLIPFNYGTYNEFTSFMINGVSYNAHFYIYAYGNDGTYSGQLFTIYLLSNSNKWYIYYYGNGIPYTLIESPQPYDSVENWYYFNFAFNSNITRISCRSNVGLHVLDVSPSVNQLVYTAFQSKNPTFLSTATVNGAYNAGYEDAKAKYNNIQAYLPGGTEYQKIYNLGKLAGESSNNTFFGLISAVIDAPIKAFTGLLNFEIFGVNIKSFLLTLFTIGLVISIVKLFMGNVGGSSE